MTANKALARLLDPPQPGERVWAWSYQRDDWVMGMVVENNKRGIKFRADKDGWCESRQRWYLQEHGKPTEKRDE